MKNFNQKPTNEGDESTFVAPDFDLAAIQQAAKENLAAIDEALGLTPEQGASSTLTSQINAQAKQLQRRIPDLQREEAVQAIVEDVQRRQFMRHTPFREDGLVSFTAISNAHRIMRSRLIKANAATIEAVYAAAFGDLEAAGASFELLVAWHNGEGR